MSSIVGVFGCGTQSSDPMVFGSMVDRAGIRGSDRSAVWHGDGASMAVCRHGWEFSADFSGDVTVLDSGGVVVAADASVYYRQELTEKLQARGVSPTGQTPSHYVLAAYRAWGEECAEKLEGDFAFVLFDRKAGQVLCARDFAGLRPLFFAQFGDTLVVASTVGAILSHPECSTDLNLACVGATAAGMLWSLGSDTCYNDINVVPPAAILSWRRGEAARIRKYWTPPSVGTRADPPFEDAADVLRGLLEKAVSERLAQSGVTTVWMSGGRDSTAVFGAGMPVLRQEGRGRMLRPISISYPEGDPGREDEIISAVADFWGEPVHWLDIENIPLFERTAERAAQREEPGAHLYENWNRALVAGTRDCGSRIALDGNGGDQLFQTSDVYLADLFVSGRWLRLTREWRRKRMRGQRHLLQSTLHPILPPALLNAFGALRGTPMRGHYLERPIPDWMNREFVARSELVERERMHLPQRRVGASEATQLRWFVSCPMPSYQSCQMSTVLQSMGIENRSPLYDRRVVEFALSRPWWERSSGLESKYLLRHAMRGLLPDDVLAPRRTRSGTTVGYSRRWMKRAYPKLFDGLFGAPLRLAELGIIDEAALRKSVATYLNHGGEFCRVELFHTLQTELWLRSHESYELCSGDDVCVEELAVVAS